MKVTPLFDNVLIEPLEAESKTSSGIIIANNDDKKSQKGKVLAVGAGKIGPNGEVHPMLVKVGDVVTYKEWGTHKVKVNGKDLIVVSQEDILIRE